MFNMRKNSTPNRYIWAHIFKKAPTSEGGTSPSDTPLRRASATAGADAPLLTSKNLPPPHFENRSAAYGLCANLIKVMKTKSQFYGLN